MSLLIMYVMFVFVAFGMNMHDSTETDEKHPWDIYSWLCLIFAPLVVVAVIGGAIGREWSLFLRDLREKESK